MTQISVISKGSHTLLNQVDSNTVSLSENSVIVVKVSKEDVASITRNGDNAMITLKNGEVIVVENYFNTANPDNSLVFEGDDGSLFWAKFTDNTGAIADVIQYQPLSEIEPLLYKDSLTGAILPWALGAGGAGLIGAAASKGSSDDKDQKTSAAPQKLTALEVADNQAPKTGKIASGKVTNDKTPVVSGSGAEAGAAIKVYDGSQLIAETTAQADGTWSVEIPANLADGSHSITASQTVGGVEGPKSDALNFTVDTQDPSVTIDDLTDTNDTTPTISGKTDEPNASIDVVIKDKNGNVADSGTGTVDGNGGWTYTPSNPLPEGEYTVDVTAKDPAGNQTAADKGGLVVDTTDPTVTIDPLTATGNDKPLLGGTIDPDAVIDIVIKDQNGNVVDSGTGTVDGNGGWTYTPSNPLPEGAYTVEVIAKDPAGNEKTETGIGLEVDKTLPSISINPLKPTNDDTPAVTGQSDADSTVKVEIKDGSGNVVDSGNAVVDSNGGWTYTPSNPLPEGAYTVEATATDPAGNQDKATDSGLTVDTTAPAVSIDPLNLTNDCTPDISGKTEAGAAVKVEIKDDSGNVVDSGNAVVNSNGVWVYTPSANLPDGSYTVEAAAKDPAGNEAQAAGNGLTVDSTPPAVSIEPLALTNVTAPVIKGAAEAGSTVAVDVKDGQGNIVSSGAAQVDSNGEWRFKPASPLADGSYIVIATAKDAAGNLATAADSGLEIDTVPPQVDIDDLFGAAAARMLMSVSSTTSASLPQTNQLKPTFSGTSTKSIEVMIYLQDESGKTVESGLANLDTATGKWTYTPSQNLAEGYYMLQAISKDAAGNQSAPAAKAFIVDIQEPAVEVDDVGLTNDVTPELTGKVNEPASTVTVKVTNVSGAVVETGTATVASDGKWSYTVKTDLVDGSYTVSATAKDKAGNISAEDTASAQIDTAAPASTLTVSATGEIVIHFSEAVKGFDKSDVTVQGGALTGLTQQADGSWTGQVVADGTTGASGTVDVSIADGAYTDLAGNAGKGSSVTGTDVPSLDTTAPTAAIAVDANGNVTITFSEPVKGFDASDLKVLGGKLENLTQQPDGSWTGTVVANGATGASGKVDLTIPAGSYTDNAGNSGQEAAASQTVPSADTTGPTATLTLDANGNLTITFSEAVKGFDASDVNVAGGKLASLTQLPDGSWTGHVVANGSTGAAANVVVSIADGTYTDLVGNTGKGGFVVENIPSVDTTAPASAIVLDVNGNLTITFSEAVKGFDASDVNVTGGTVSGLIEQGDGSWTGKVVADGNTGALGSVTVSVADSSYTDLTGNNGTGSTASKYIPSADSTAPAATIAVGSNGEVIISFSEAVKGFTPSDVQVTGGTLTGLTQQPDGSWKGQVIADGVTGSLGKVDLTIPAGSYTDNAGNAGQEATASQSVPSVDATVPAAAISIAPNGDVMISFSEPVKGFDASDVNVTGGTLTGLTQQPDGSWIGHAVSNDLNGAPGLVEITIAAGSYTDNAGNPGLAASNSLMVPGYDTTAPTSSMVLDAAGNLTITFSEAVKGFDIADVKVTGGTVSGLTKNADGIWSAKVTTAAAAGSAVTIALADGSYTDLAGNAGKGSSVQQSVDSTAPSATITLDAQGNVVITFSEKVTGFNASDLKVTGALVAGLTEQPDGSWIGEIKVPTAGVNTPVSFEIAAGSFEDLAGNKGLEAEWDTIIYPPTVDIDDLFGASAFAASVTLFAARTTLAAAALPPATNNSQQTFTGTSSKSVEVQINIYDSSNNLIDSGLANLDVSTGRWTYNAASPLADGQYRLEAISKDASGAVSAPAYKDFIVDTVKPEIDIDQAGIAADPSPSFSGKTEAGATVTVTVKDQAGNVVATGAGAVDSQGNWMFDAGALADGSYTVEAIAKDRAGNISDKAATPLTVDTYAQLDALLVTANPDGTATVTGKSEPGATVTVKDPNGNDLTVTVNPDGTFTATVPTPAPEGTYTASAKDAAGNTATATDDLDDNVAPTIDGLDVAPNADGTATVTGKTEPGAAVTVTDPNGNSVPVTVNPDGSFTATVPAPAAEGTYTAEATDKAGNTGTATDDFIDTTVPAILTAEVDSQTGGFVFGKSQPGAVITVYAEDGKTVLGAGTASAAGEYSVTLSPAQVDGEQVKVTAKDPGGESAPITAAAPDLYAPDAPSAQVAADGKSVTGQTEPNAAVQVYGGSKGTTVIGTAIAGADGKYAVALNPALVDGENVKVTAKDPGGESLAASAQAPDLYAPDAPAANFNAKGDTISGTAEANTDIKVYAQDGKTVIAQGKSDASGNYSIKLPSAYNDAQTLLVSASDAGGESGKSGVKAPNIQMDAVDNLVSAGINFDYPVTETRSLKLFSHTSLIDLCTETYSSQFTIGANEVGNAVITVSTSSLVNLFDVAVMKLYSLNADGSWTLIGSNKDAGLLDLLGIFGESTQVKANNLQTGTYKFEFTGGAAIGVLTSVKASLVLTIQDTSKDPSVSSVSEAYGNVVTDNDSIYGQDTVPAGSTVTSVNGQTLNASGSTVIVGDHGVLTIAQDGTYSYKPNANAANIGKSEVFSYTVTDPATGKTDTASLIIHIGTQSDLAVEWDAADPAVDATTVAATDNSNTIGFDASNAVSTAKASVISYSWAIGVGNTKSGLSKFTVADGTIEDIKISFGSSQLVSLLGKTVINVYDTAGKLVATTGASNLLDVITLLPNGNSLTLSGLTAGEYTIKAVTNTGLSLGGSVSATITRTVIDLDDFTVKTTSTAAKGNIFTDDNGSGADTLASKYTDLYISTDGGQTYSAVSSTGTTVQGEHGKLVISADGSYSYSATDGTVLSGAVESFTYKLVAPNGDVSTASLTINAGVNFTGSTGNDVISSTAGNDVMTSKTGADTVIFKLLNGSDAGGGNGHDTWTDFNKAEGDKIDVSQLLQGQNVDKSNISQFITVTSDGKGNTVISIDRDGAASKTYDKVELLTLKNTDISLQELLDNNHLVF